MNAKAAAAIAGRLWVILNIKNFLAFPQRPSAQHTPLTSVRHSGKEANSGHGSEECGTSLFGIDGADAGEFTPRHPQRFVMPGLGPGIHAVSLMSHQPRSAEKHRRYRMGPRVKPGDDDNREGLR